MENAALSTLPEEIQMEVLLRLPVKSLLRFRAVRRSWAALLSSEEFCASWTKLADPTTTEPAAQLLFLRFDRWRADRYIEVVSGDGRPLFTLDGVCGHSEVMAPAPCRGLTLLHDQGTGRYHVFNATTRAALTLPPPPSCFDGALMLQPTSSTAGLGFDERTKAHKVVQLVSSRKPAERMFTRIRCEVHNLGRGSDRRWRPPSSSTDADGMVAPSTPAGAALLAKLMTNSGPVFADGFLHWLVDPSFYNSAADASRYMAPVLSFSLAEETFSSQVRPPPFDWDITQVHLAELDGRLCMVRDLRGGSSDRLEIWSYGAGDDVWSLEHRIDLAQHAGRDLLTEPKYIRVLGVSAGKKVIFVATSRGNVVAYDPMSGTLETILQLGGTNLGREETWRFFPRVSLFKQSFTPVQ